jgi:hypothetical protein
MWVATVVSWVFVFGIPAWLVIEEVASHLGGWRALEAGWE